MSPVALANANRLLRWKIVVCAGFSTALNLPPT
jgi:hypothetical protein